MESPLITSAFNFLANFILKLVLPTAVGPTLLITFFTFFPLLLYLFQKSFLCSLPLPLFISLFTFLESPLITSAFNFLANFILKLVLPTAVCPTMMITFSTFYPLQFYLFKKSFTFLLYF